MPTLEFNGKHYIYTHLIVPYQPLETGESHQINS